jgi:hypothetical protein
MSEPWSGQQAFDDLCVLGAVLAPLAEADRPGAAARWFQSRYGAALGAQRFVLFVRICQYLARFDDWFADRALATAIDRDLLDGLLARFGVEAGAMAPAARWPGQGQATEVASVPHLVPPDDKPEP